MKKGIFLLYIAAICLIIGIAYANWIVTIQKDISLIYDPLSYINYELNNKETYYNGSDQFPTSSNLSGIENDLDYNISYQYMSFADASYGPYTDGLPKNAGNYIITISYNSESIDLYYKINRNQYDISEITFTDASYDYDGTERTLTIDGTLPEGVSVQYKYDDVVTTGVTNAGTYNVTAEFSGDTLNYEAISPMNASLVINQIDDPSYVALTSFEAIAGQTLGDIILPSNFSWVDPLTTPVGAEGQNTFYVNYTPIDTVNYKSLTDLPVIVNVSGSSTNNLVIVVNDNQEVVYNGLPQYPVYSIVDSSNTNVESTYYTLTFEYKLASDSEYTTGYPKNAGVYNVKITCASNSSLYLDSEEVVLTFTINKKVISLNTTILEQNYDSANRTWALLSTLIKSNLSLDGVESGDTCDFTINGMHNGKYKYGTVIGSYTAPTSDSIFGSSYTNVIGSTYQVFISISNDNYELSSDRFILKYKTAKIGSTFYTIEDAILNMGSSTITFAGDTTSTTTYVATMFTRLDTSVTGYASNSEFNITGGKILVPYTDGGTSELGQQKDTNNGNKVCSALIVPQGVTINFKNSSKLTAAGEIYAVAGGQTSNTKLCGVIENMGTINFASGTTLVSYGYIKGTGIINLASGATCTDVMTCLDWPGGTAAKGFYTKVFITNSYNVHNIASPMNINAGATYKVYVQTAVTLIGIQDCTVTLVAPSGTKNCLFTPTGTTGNIYKTVSDVNHYVPITTVNQSTSSTSTTKYKDVFEVSGDYKDGSVSASVIVTVSTGTSKACPIGLMDLRIKSGSTLTISAADYLFLPGSRLVIEEGATVNVTNGAVDFVFTTYDEVHAHTGNREFSSNNYSTDHSDAYLECNGTFTCAGNFGGKITTTSQTAVVNLNNGVIGSYGLMYNATEDGYYNSTSTTKMKLYNNGSVSSNFSVISSAASFYSIKDSSNNYGFYATSGVISYDTNGGVESYSNKNISIGQSGYTISSSDIPGTPTRPYYVFDYWYISGTNTGNAIGQTVYSGVSLVAHWTPITYSIEYVDVYDGNFATGNTSNANGITNNTTFNVLTSKSLTDPINSNYIFAGFYTDVNCINKVLTIDGQLLVNYLSDGHVTLYAKWFAPGANKYVIYFNNTSTDVVCANKESIVATDSYDWSSYSLPVMTGKDNDYNVSKYFDGWYYGDTKISSVDSSMFAYNGSTYELELSAVWANKNSLGIYFGAGALMDTVYYKSGYSFTVPALPAELNTIKVGNNSQIFMNWVFNDTSTCVVGDHVTLTNQTTLEPVYKTYITVTINTNSYTTVNVTGVSGYIVENGVLSSFVGKTYKNGDSFMVVEGSKFNAKYTAANSSKNNAAAITGTTPTTALSTTDREYTVGTSNVTITPSGESNSCVTANTLITLTDGSKMMVKDLTGNELLLVWNFETGTFDSAPITFIDSDPLGLYEVITLTFSDGTNVDIITEHGFFDVDLAKYVYLDKNASSYIGHHFVNENNEIVTLVDVTIEEKVVQPYSPTTFGTFCYYVNGMLSMPGGINGMFNYFDVETETMKYDEEQMAKDIALYGELTLEDYEGLINEYAFDAFCGKWLSVSIGKGLITWEDIEYLVERYSVFFNDK